MKQHQYLGYDDVRQGLGAHEELMSTFILQGLLVVLEVILDAVVDVRDLADLKLPALQLEVFLQLGPAANQQLPGLTVVQGEVCNRTHGSKLDCYTC